MSGECEEIVYQDRYSDDKKSQLLWRLRPMAYMGIDLHYGWQKRESDSKFPARFFSGFFADASFKLGFPGDAGLMEDRDWLYSDPDQLTHYSAHDNYIETAFLFDISIGKSFIPCNGIKLKPFVSYSYMYYLWGARGGSILYPHYQNPPYTGNWYDGHEYLGTSGEVITYSQSWNIISPGISFYGNFNKYFDIELLFKISPFVWAIAVDNHILRYTVFTDYIIGGLFIEPALLFSFKAGSLLTLSYSYSYRNISHARGDTAVGERGIQTSVGYNCIGAGYSVHRAGIVAKLNLTNQTR